MIKDHRSAVSPVDTKSFSRDNEVLSSHGGKVLQKDSGLSYIKDVQDVSQGTCAWSWHSEDGCREKPQPAKYRLSTFSNPQNTLLHSQGKYLF